MVANRNSQSWDFGTLKINNLARITCPPTTVVLPGDSKSGQELGWSCIGTNTATPGRTIEAPTARIVGMDAMRIGGAVVPTIRELQQITVTGGQRGTDTENWWFVASSGLPVRMERHITLFEQLADRHHHLQRDRLLADDLPGAPNLNGRSTT